MTIAQRRLARIGYTLDCHCPNGILLLLTWGKNSHRLLLSTTARGVVRGASRSWYKLWRHKVHTLIAVI